jgi:hypothetical protein
MKCVVLCALAIALLAAAGCKKQVARSAATPPVAVPQEQESSQEQANVPTESDQSTSTQPKTGPHDSGIPITPPPPVVIQENPNTDIVLGQLTRALRNYVISTQSAPKTFEEFISVSRVQAPPPPPGKKYVINHGMVILKNS